VISNLISYIYISFYFIRFVKIDRVALFDDEEDEEELSFFANFFGIFGVYIVIFK